MTAKELSASSAGPFHIRMERNVAPCDILPRGLASPAGVRMGGALPLATLYWSAQPWGGAGATSQSCAPQRLLRCSQQACKQASAPPGPVMSVPNEAQHMPRSARQEHGVTRQQYQSVPLTPAVPEVHGHQAAVLLVEPHLHPTSSRGPVGKLRSLPLSRLPSAPGTSHLLLLHAALRSPP